MNLRQFAVSVFPLIKDQRLEKNVEILSQGKKTLAEQEKKSSANVRIYK